MFWQILQKTQTLEFLRKEIWFYLFSSSSNFKLIFHSKIYMYPCNVSFLNKNCQRHTKNFLYFEIWYFTCNCISDLLTITYICHVLYSHLQFSGFVLNEKFQRNASKFAIFYIYENPKLLFPFFISCYFIFSLMNALVYVEIDQVIH